MAMRCQACNSPRSQDPCPKCGSKLVKAHPDWEEPALPPIEHIREAAKEVGYAIAVHGSLERDLDLIAAPWTEAAVDAQALISHVASRIGAIVVDVEKKPLGRVAASLQPSGWFKLIDLSVCPIVVD